MGSNQSVEPQSMTVMLPEKGGEKYSNIYRNAQAKEALRTHIADDSRTLYQLFQRGVGITGDGHCYGSRPVLVDGSRGPYEWVSYNEANHRVSAFAAGLAHLEIKPSGGHYGIYGINRPEWLIAEHAAYKQSMVNVSLYDTLGPDAIRHIINHAELPLVVCSRDRIEKLCEAAPDCETLRIVVSMDDDLRDDDRAACEKANLTLYTFSEVLKLGEEHPVEDVPPEMDTIATIMYTSGTTGLPKGVLLTHGNIIACLTGAILNGVLFYKEDVHISYLPMAHIFERVVQGVILQEGGAIGFWQGQVPKLFDDIAMLQPTVFPSVPRLFNRLYDKINAQVSQAPSFKQYLVEWGMGSKRKTIDEGKPPTDWLWDRIVFKKFRQFLGGRVRIIITGSAPISSEVFRFLQILFSVPVVQGYGMTETAACISSTVIGDNTAGHVGSPVATTEVALMDVPEMGYSIHSDPPAGEVCCRGANCTQGYYKDEAKTAELWQDGWLHTGDIGVMQKDGRLKIVDRKKNIFKLSQGEYVAIEYVEDAYIRNRFVEQIFAYGDSLQSTLVAVVVPDREVLIPWAKEQGLVDPEDFEALCANPDVKKAVLDSMTENAREKKLKGFEMVKDVYLSPKPFSVEDDILTPTFKMKRPQARKFFQEQIDAMYANINAAASK